MKIQLKENIYLNGKKNRGDVIEVSNETYNTIKDVIKFDVLEEKQEVKKEKTPVKQG
jgi:hypothetical protein